MTDKDSDLLLLGVNESDNSPLENDPVVINNYHNLAVEATMINEYLSEAVIGDEIKCDITKLSELHPFASNHPEKDKDLERALYCYKEWRVPYDLIILVRCTVHCGNLISYDEDEEDLIKYNIFAITEYNIS